MRYCVRQIVTLLTGMEGSKVRAAFLKFFAQHHHQVVPSSSLVPHNDPTLLFSNAGMNQFKDCFLGAEKREYVRAASCQKCLRISGKHNDFENVGVTARHHTFFEMLGNFSFGDYFKSDAIRFAWEFITGVMKLPESKLWITIYEKDDEAFELWQKIAGVNPGRIVRLGEADNFWAMGDTGPCGPCSEIHYYRGKDENAQSAQALASDGSSYLEFWNLVFMQYNRSADGTLNPLPRPSVDTGMGLERMASILQGVEANYDTDLLRPIISVCEKLSGKTYGGAVYQGDLKSDLTYARDVAMRAIADHARAAAFLVADGVLPASDGRGYVLRRLIRRAIRHGRVLEFQAPFFANTAKEVVRMMGSHYPELVEQSNLIDRVLDNEERKFHETLDSGLTILKREVESLPKSAPFPGKSAFLLHDTYGFPLDLTEDALKSYGIKVDQEAFDQAMLNQRARSRQDRSAQDISYQSVTINGNKTNFVGYDSVSCNSKLQAVLTEGIAQVGDSVSLVFEETPFYAESGGQVSDTGTIQFDNGTLLRVQDVQKVQDGYFIHHAVVEHGTVTKSLQSTSAKLIVDAERRNKIRAHHSATHLVHAALRKVLGAHVKQAGSRVDDNSLRFDYAHFEAPSASQLEEVQAIVNAEVRANYPVSTRIMELSEAKKLGATALFGEKYSNSVRVVEIGPNSLELCGGTHAASSAEIAVVMLMRESGVAAGVRRIECWAGHSAFAELLNMQRERQQLMSLLKCEGSELPEKLEKLLSRTKATERELDQAKVKLASSSSNDLIGTARTSPKGVRVISSIVQDADAEALKNMVDRLRVSLGSGVVALGSSQAGGKAVIVAGVTADLVSQINAGSIVKELAKLSGGKGGGRADFAQAGGVDPELLSKSLERVFDLIT